MKHNRPLLILVALSSLILITVQVRAETDEEAFQRYGQKYLAAKSEGDLGTAFDMLLKADAAKPNPTCKGEAVILIHTALTKDPRTGKTYDDLDAHLAKGYSEEWLRRALRCPIPDDESSGVLHYEYGIVSMTLGLHYNNINRDVDKAAGALALSEKHMKIACAKDEEIKVACEDAGLKSNYRSLRAQLDKNRVALAYERARGTFKAFEDFTEKYAPAQEANGSDHADKADSAKPMVKTYRVMGDARGNERPEDIDANGGNAITIEGADGTYIVTYEFNYPTRYLIKGGGDLSGKNVEVYFKEGKATGITCDAGNGVCKITGFTKR
jgi:hypothetical protein